MKKIFQKLLLLTTVGSFIFLYSCGSDDPEPLASPPNITVTATASATGLVGDGFGFHAGETVTFSVAVTAPEGFNVLRVSNGITAEFSRTDLGLDAGATSATAEFEIVTVAADAGSTVILDFEAVDDADQTSEASFTFNITSPNARIHTAVLLMAPTADEDSKTFYSIDSDTEYSVNDVEATAGSSATIDIGYFFVTEANLASPSDYSTAFTGAYDISDWDVRRETKMVLTTLDVQAFIEIITVADVLTSTDGIVFETNGLSTVEGLTTGDIYAFKTADGLVGLMRVEEINPGFDALGFVKLEFALAAP